MLLAQYDKVSFAQQLDTFAYLLFDLLLFFSSVCEYKILQKQISGIFFSPTIYTSGIKFNLPGDCSRPLPSGG